MTASEADTFGRRRLKLRLWHIGVALLCLIVAGVLSMRYYWRAQFQRRIEAIRAAGFPATRKELDAWYLWPSSGQNAAYWITGAAPLHQKPRQRYWRLLEQIVDRRGARPDPNQPIPEDLGDLLEIYLRENTKALAMLHDTASIAECRYPLDLSQDSSIALPHTADVQDGCLLLCSEAILCAEDGDPNGATRALEAALRVARSLDREPILVSYRVHMEGVSRVAATLEWALNAVAFTEKQLVGLDRAFNSIHAHDSLVRAVVGDRCLFLRAFEKSRTLGKSHSPEVETVVLWEVCNAIGLTARQGAIFLDHMEEWLRIVQLPAFQRLAAIDAIAARYRRNGKGLLAGRLDTRGMRAMMVSDLECMAQLEMARVLPAVERYRLAHADLPETLDQLVPDYLAAVPTDPFDGMPLRYKRYDRGFLVYSVGEDGKDDGGRQKPRKTEESGETSDLVFRIERQE